MCVRIAEFRRQLRKRCSAETAGGVPKCAGRLRNSCRPEQYARAGLGTTRCGVKLRAVRVEHPPRHREAQPDTAAPLVEHMPFGFRFSLECRDRLRVADEQLVRALRPLLTDRQTVLADELATECRDHGSDRLREA